MQAIWRWAARRAKRSPSAAADGSAEAVFRPPRRPSTPQRIVNRLLSIGSVWGLPAVSLAYT
jgi:hypothetical protein